MSIFAELKMLVDEFFIILGEFFPLFALDLGSMYEETHVKHHRHRRTSYHKKLRSSRDSLRRSFIPSDSEELLDLSSD